MSRLEHPLALPPSLEVPGDPSSAAFWLGAGLLVPGARVAVRGVDVNPTRTGFLAVLERMGAVVEREPEPKRGRETRWPRSESGAVRVCGGRRSCPSEVPSLLDEVPLLAVVASQARGETRLTGARELRVKESDRLRQLVLGLRAMGAEVEELDDGFVLQGPARLRGAAIDAGERPSDRHGLRHRRAGRRRGDGDRRARNGPTSRTLGSSPPWAGPARTRSRPGGVTWR